MWLPLNSVLWLEHVRLESFMSSLHEHTFQLMTTWAFLERELHVTVSDEIDDSSYSRDFYRRYIVIVNAIQTGSLQIWQPPPY